MAPKLFAVALRAVRRRETAEDILQDVFVTTWNKAVLFDGSRGNAQAWLYTITRHKIIDTLRKSRRETVGADADVATESHPKGLPYWIGPETHMTLRACISTLRPDTRRALLLCFIDGHSHEEAAQKMNVPLGTLKSRVRRALETIRLELSRDGSCAA